MKTVYFHIGNFKTGTTSIQHFCNTSELDFCYPTCSRPVRNKNNHGKLSLSLLRDYGNVIPPVWFVDKDIDFHSEAQSLIREIDAHPASTALISSEEFFRIGKAENPSFVAAQLKEAFSKYNTKVIMYAREPFSFLLSWYNQVLVDGARNFLVFSSRPYQRLLASQNPIYETYANCFGKENVIVLKHEQYGAQHLNDFFTAIGSQCTIRKNKKCVLNSRKSHRVTEVRRIASYEGTAQFAITSHDITFEYILEAIEYINSEIEKLNKATGIELESHLTLDNILDHYFKRLLPLGRLVDPEADCLKEFALSAESYDLNIALKFMEAAASIRPTCDCMREKIAEYRQGLEASGQTDISAPLRPPQYAIA